MAGPYVSNTPQGGAATEGTPFLITMLHMLHMPGRREKNGESRSSLSRHKGFVDPAQLCRISTGCLDPRKERPSSRGRSKASIGGLTASAVRLGGSTGRMQMEEAGPAAAWTGHGLGACDDSGQARPRRALKVSRAVLVGSRGRESSTKRNRRVYFAKTSNLSHRGGSVQQDAGKRYGSISGQRARMQLTQAKKTAVVLP